MKEFKENKIPLTLQYFFHCRIASETFRGYIDKERINRVLWRHHNIPKRMCPLIIKELEIMGLLTKEKDFIKVKEARPEEVVIKGLEKSFGLLQ